MTMIRFTQSVSCFTYRSHDDWLWADVTTRLRAFDRGAILSAEPVDEWDEPDSTLFALADGSFVKVPTSAFVIVDETDSRPIRVDHPEYLSIEGAAGVADLSYDHIRRAVVSGDLRASNKGNGRKPVYRIHRSDFDSWMQKGRGPAIPARAKLKSLMARHLPRLS
jgi:excisionase family DNA binding protein